MFFWLTEERLSSVLSAPVYRDRKHIVLTVDTAALFASHAGRVQLSVINSGSTYHNPPQRGRDTFLAPKDYPFEDRWKKYFRRGAVAELTVDRAVSDAWNRSAEDAPITRSAYHPAQREKP